MGIAVCYLRVDRKDAEGVVRWASRSNNAKVFVAEADGKVVGFVMLEWPRTGWNRVAEIGWLAVLAEYQRRGFGGALMRRIEQYAKEAGMRKIYVEPRADNDIALHFYIKNGYKLEAMRKDWYEDGKDSVILGKHLLKT